MSSELRSLFPLPIPHQDRKSPLDFIPDCPDTYGYGEKLLAIWHRLQVTQGPKAGQTFKQAAAPWQNKFIKSLFGHCDEDGTLFHKEALLYISKKQGKALPIKTPIFTPRGWTTMGDLKVGDYVYGLNGNPTKVIKTTEVMLDHDCYNVTLSDGRNLITDKDHLWKVSSRKTRDSGRNWIVVNTYSISKKIIVNKNERNYQIPTNQPLNNPIAQLPLDPYTLGVWLGDGDNSGSRLSLNGDDTKEIISRITANLGYGLVVKKVKGANCNYVSLTSGRGHKYKYGTTVRNVLSNINLFHNKHIPISYFNASRSQRLALLQGLMDTDGTVSLNSGKYPHCEFNSTCEKLADDVFFLIRTLGYKVTRSTRVARLYGKSCGIDHRLRFTAYREDDVFFIVRKNDRLRKTPNEKTRSSTVKITGCELVESEPVCCISVGASDGMFLAGHDLIPTHNSSMAGPLAIAATLAFPTERGHVVILASTQKQAGIVYDAMCGTIEADPFLMQQFKIRRYKNDIIHNVTMTKLSALPLEASALVGVIPSLAFVDELHVIGNLPKAKQLIEQVVSGGAVSINFLCVYLTTAPLDKSVGVFKSMYQRAKRIHRGEIGTDRLFPILFELYDDDAEKDDPSKWWQSNPSLGYTFTEEWLIESYNTAINDEDPTSIFNFYSQHLNIQAGDKFGISQWIPLEMWDRYSNPNLNLKKIIRDSEVLYVSVDLGYRDDPSSIVVLGEKTINFETNEKEYSIFCQQYVHEDGYNKRKNQVHYDEFIASGELIVSNINDFDKVEIIKMVMEVNKTKKLAAVGMDAYKSRSLATTLIQMKIEVVAVPQGWKLNPALIETERTLYNGLLINDGRPMLRWNVGNGQLIERGQAMALIKPNDIHHSKNKIDGLVCVVMCMNMASDPEIKPKIIDIGGMIG